ncbi:TPA: hypothetical protein HA242_06580 [Candidatus Woesearchaeota archaeon]|nr:hypothetical protein [Candidatus Woesearchaeota archaeon]HIG93071.1 hypothetical protein [Candidatus Woesearchaeota archaeon]HIH13361.1 hypothetical protein [Candidatus Woesearchaeota archaeon]
MGTLPFVVRQHDVIRTVHTPTQETIDVLVTGIAAKTGLRVQVMRDLKREPEQMICIGQTISLHDELEIQAYRRAGDSWASWGRLVYKAPMEYKICRGMYNSQGEFQSSRHVDQ